MPSPDSKGGGSVDSLSIRAKDPGGVELGAKPRSKSSSTRRSSHGSTTSSGVPNSTSGTVNGTAKKVSHVPCKFYRQGVCQAGDNCPFSHDTEAVNQAVCKYFQKGNCKFGSKCALAHITADGRRVNTKKDKLANSKSQQHQSHPASAPSADTSRSGGNGHLKSTTAAATVSTPLATKPVSSSYLGSIFNSKPVMASSGSPLASAVDDRSLSTSAGSDLGSMPPGFVGGAPIGSPGASLSSNSTIMPPLLSSANVLNPHSTSARSSFSFSRTTASSNSVRSASFLSSNITESHLFSGQRVGSMSRMGSTGSSSIWADRLMNPLSYEGSAIVDDDEDDEDDEEDIDLGEGFEEDLVPPSLSDLLTPQERERRNSRHSSSARPTIINSPSASEFWSNTRTHRTSSGHQARVLEPIGTPDKTNTADSQSLNVNGLGMGICEPTVSNGD